MKISIINAMSKQEVLVNILWRVDIYNFCDNIMIVEKYNKGDKGEKECFLL